MMKHNVMPWEKQLFNLSLSFCMMNNYEVNASSCVLLQNREYEFYLIILQNSLADNQL